MKRYESPTIEMVGGVEGGNGEGVKTETWLYAWGYVAVDIILAAAFYVLLALVAILPPTSNEKLEK